MPDTPKEKKESDESERSYYYDDAHGYEDYDPEEGDDSSLDEKGLDDRSA